MTRSTSSSRATAALWLTIAGLAVFSVARRPLPDAAQLPLNLAMAGAVGALAWWAGLSAGELGLRRDRLGSGLRWGLAAFALVVAVLVPLALLRGSLFDDDRAEVGVGGLLFEVLVSIPLGTVLLEELAFRGSLLALFRRRTTTWRAVLASSVLFGFWHIAVAAGSAGSNAAVADSTGSGPGLVVAVVVTVAATTVAGLVFCWLRLRSESLVAPALAHDATNAVAFTLAWIVAR